MLGEVGGIGWAWGEGVSVGFEEAKHISGDWSLNPLM